MRGWFAALFAALLLLSSPAKADERILHFLSDVAVQKDGALEVKETIRLRAEGNEIQRGILRDFPTRYRSRGGRQVRVGFEVLGVERNGSAEPWALESISNGKRVRIGDADVLLPEGEHVYTIRYRTTRQLGRFEKFDELYWNATGTDWTFPIDVAEVRIRLPEAAAFGQRSVYTGPQGSTAGYAEMISEKPGEIVFRTTAPLSAYEGLTVAVAWPKGVIDPPSAETQAGWWLADNGPPFFALFGLFGVLAYYFIAWRRAGRGPLAGTVVPVFSPPEDMSAAAVRYVSRMDADDRTFAAALVDLGVRGKLRLVEEDGGFFSRTETVIERMGGGTAALPAPENAMWNALFSGGDSILMDQRHHVTFRAAQNALQEGLKKQYEGSLFVRNWEWSLRGLILTAAAVWLTAIAVALAEGGNLFVSLGSAAFVTGAFLVYRANKGTGSVFGIVGKMVAILIGLIGIGLAGATLLMALESGRILPLLVPLIALPVVISAFWWMAAPTRQGRIVMDRIAGFRQYLSITEEERLERMHPPEKTPELFEKYLPYAIALKVENEWASRFTSILAAASTAGQQGTMSWYSGDSSPWNDTEDFVGRIGSSLASSVSSASTAPGSSSGSGGGGSSGGGGGGGGGSGW